MNRENQIDCINKSEFDVTIIGGGVSGARLYDELCGRGCRVLLVDKGDFGCGTSQASGMMIWGGLLYLKNLDFKTVYKLCKARDGLISSFPDKVDSCSFRYMPCKKGGRSRSFVYSALMLYWLLGSRKRHLPKSEKLFSEVDLIQKCKFKSSLVYEEAFLNLSDSRFVLEWLMPWKSEYNQALNYCSVQESHFDGKLWNLDILDSRTNRNVSCRSKYIVNAAGVWTDEVNAEFGIDSKYKHIFSKGVHINLPRPEEHKTAMIFEMGQHGDSQSYVPWGPVSMWGPTETTVENLREGFSPSEEDIEFLLNMANKNLSKKATVEDIVSVRCGVRPLAVESSFNNKDVYPLDLSRKHRVFHDKSKNFLALYGGKLTSCGILAEEVAEKLNLQERNLTKRIIEQPDSFISFPGISGRMPSPQWCRDHEACYTLEDYLRRRSNISQWVANEGFGKHWQNEQLLREIAAVFPKGDEEFKEKISKVKNNIINRMVDNGEVDNRKRSSEHSLACI